MQTTFRGIIHNPCNCDADRAQAQTFRDHPLTLSASNPEGELVYLTGRDVVDFAKRALKLDTPPELQEATRAGLAKHMKGSRLDAAYKKRLNGLLAQFYQQLKAAAANVGWTEVHLSRAIFEYFQRQQYTTQADANREAIVELLPICRTSIEAAE